MKLPLIVYMSEECFVIPVKHDSPSQEQLLIRCIGSIRRYYPDSPLAIVVAPNSLPITLQPDVNTLVLENPHFSTFGALSLYNERAWARRAWFLHDSAVVVHPLPKTDDRIAFLFHFDGGLDRGLNDRGYRRLLTDVEYRDMLATYNFGCFGNIFTVEHAAVPDLGILEMVPMIQSKYDFECMERILAYKASCRAMLSRRSLFGSVFQQVVDPWKHTEYKDWSVDQFVTSRYPYPLAKAIIARR